MAKKILAAVLAVMVAISAMAITAFADVEIPLYPLQRDANGNLVYDSNGLVYSDVNLYSSRSITLDIPVTGLYGYMTQGCYFDLTLPRMVGGNLGNDDNGDGLPDNIISWSVVVAGQEYALEAQFCSNNTDDVSVHRVYFGIFGQDWTAASGYTTIPQTAVFGGITSIKIVGTLQQAGHYSAQLSVDHMTDEGYYDQNKANAYNCFAAFYDANGDPIPGNTQLFITNMNPQVVDNTLTGTSNSGYVWASGDWTTAFLQYDQGRFTQGGGQYTYNNNTVHPIVWDHTLANRAAIASSASDTVKLVVELANPIVGGATYTLWAYDNSSASEWYLNYTGSRKYVSQVQVDGKVDKLEFDVPLEYLSDSTYGNMNTEFAIFENITLFDAYSSIMRSPLRYNSQWWNKGAVGVKPGVSLDLSLTGAGTLGRLSWNYGDKVYYDGEQVRYAAGGMTDVDSYADYANGLSGEEVVQAAYDAYLATLPADNQPNGQDPYTIVDYYIDCGIAYTRYTQDADLAPALATKLYLLIPEAEQTTDDVVPPTEQADSEEDPAEGDTDMTVDDTNEPAEDPNPHTGLALALVPMMIAAAAAVVSKKH